MSNNYTRRGASRRGGTFDTFDSGSYSDDYSRSCDSLSFDSADDDDDDSRHFPHLADLIPIPGMRATAEDLDRLIDDYLDGGWANYIDQAAINKFFTGSSKTSSVGSSMDDDTEFMSAFSPAGSIHINPAEAEDALTKLSTVTPSYYDDSTRSRYSTQPVKSIPHKEISISQQQSGSVQASDSNVRNESRVSNKLHNSKIRHPKLSLPLRRLTKVARGPVVDLTSGAADILEDLRVSKGDNPPHSLGQKLSEGSKSMDKLLLKAASDEEEILFDDDKPDKLHAKTDKLWGGLSLWEKVPFSSEHVPAKPRKGQNRVTFAATPPEVRRGGLWADVSKDDDQKDVVDIINHLSSKDTSARESLVGTLQGVNEGKSDLSKSATAPALGFVRTPLSPAILGIPPPPPVRDNGNSNMRYSAPHARNAASGGTRSPLFPRNKSPSRSFTRPDPKTTYYSKGMKKVPVSDSSMKQAAARTAKRVLPRVEDVLLSPPHDPFSYTLDRSSVPKVHHGNLPNRVPREDVRNNSTKGVTKRGLRQRAQSKLAVRDQPSQEELGTNNAYKGETQPQVESQVHSSDVDQGSASDPNPLIYEAMRHFRCERVDDGSEVEIRLEEEASDSEINQDSEETRVKTPSVSWRFRGRRRERNHIGSIDTQQIDPIQEHIESADNAESNSKSNINSNETTIPANDQSDQIDAEKSDAASSPEKGNIEAVLNLINLYDSDGNKVDQIGAYRRSFGLSSPFARQLRSPSTPIKIDMDFERVELEARSFAAYEAEESSDAGLKEIEDLPVRKRSMPGSAVLDRIRSLTPVKERKEDKPPTPSSTSQARSDPACPSNSPIVKDQVQGSGQHDAIMEMGADRGNETALFDDDSILDAPRESQVVSNSGANDKGSDSEMTKSQRLSLTCDSLGGPCAFDEDSNEKVLPHARNNPQNLPEETSFTNVEDNTDITRTTETNPTGESTASARDLKVPSMSTSQRGVKGAINLIARVRSHVHMQADEKIINDSAGVEVSISKGNKNLLRKAGKLLTPCARLPSIEKKAKRKKKPETPSFEEAYKHLKAKLMDGPSSLLKGKTEREPYKAPVDELYTIPTANPENKVPVIVDSAVVPNPSTPRYLIAKGNATCRTLFGSPLLTRGLCGAETPDSFRSHRNVFGVALNACREPELSPSASDFPDDNSLLDIPERAIPEIVMEDKDIVKTPIVKKGLRTNLVSIRQRVGFKKSSKNQSERPATPSSIPKKLPHFRKHIWSRNTASTKDSTTVEARNPPTNDGKPRSETWGEQRRDQPEATGVTERAGRERIRTKARSKSRSRSKELSVEKKKKLKYLESTVERRLQADQALLEAIKAKMATSPRNKKRRNRKKSMLEQIEDHLELPAGCLQTIKREQGDNVQTLAGSIGGILACADPKLAIKEVESP